MPLAQWLAAGVGRGAECAGAVEGVEIRHFRVDLDAFVVAVVELNDAFNRSRVSTNIMIRQFEGKFVIADLMVSSNYQVIVKEFFRIFLCLRGRSISCKLVTPRQQ